MSKKRRGIGWSLDRKGQSLTEYLILLLLIAGVSVTVTRTLGKTIKKKIESANNHIDSKVSLFQ